MKILTVIGARPQFVKAAVVSREIKRHPEMKEVIIHTGQHYDQNMSDVFFEEMNIPRPHYNLNVNGLSHGAMTGQMLEKIEEIILGEKPDVVNVYGDTNSTLSGALAAGKLHVKVSHIEAGLRSFNMKMPEEINRILTDRVSNLLFCPTDTAIENLKREGYDNFDCRIIKSGDVMYDSVLYYSQFSGARSEIIKSLKLNNFILCTVHRAENTDNPHNLNSIINALNSINKNIPVVLPLHPRTRKIIESRGLKPEFTVIEPIGYFDMIELLKNCSLVMTDSGGLQKESFFFKKHCVTLREETEWVELVNYGYNVLAGSEENLITEKTEEMLNKKSDFSIDLYGKGDASRIIVNSIKESFGII